MMRLVSTIMVSLVLILVPNLMSCGSSVSQQESDAHLRYLTFSGSNRCTLNYAREAEVRLCVSGTSGATLEKAKDYSKRALLTWFRALRQIDDKVTSNVVFSCNSPHLTVNMIPGSGTSYASCGRANIYTQKTYGTYLHEFGHAVAALSDTYTGRSAGACRSGQPKSVMCWGAYGPNKDAAGFSLLYQDDVNGIQAVYKRIMQSRGPMTPPSVQIDPLGSIDPNNPWPTASGNSGLNNGGNQFGRDIFVSLARKQLFQRSSEVVRISTRINLDKVVICQGVVKDVEACVANSSAYPVQYAERVGNRKVYTTTVQTGGIKAIDLTVFAGGELNGKFHPSDRKSFRLQRD